MSETHPCCRSHCCKAHGCKYGHDDCPVVSGEEVQEFPCETCDFARERAGATAGQVVMERPELLRILNQNAQMARQITELQMSLTMKEEHLRAHRRARLNEAQTAALEADLASTTDRVNKGYEELVRKMGP